jgi:flagellar biosynthesis protein FlhB
VADDDQKTEEPSGKRLTEAQEKGQVVESQEVGHWFMLFAATLIVALFAGSIARSMGNRLLPFLEAPHLIAMDSGRLLDMLFRLTGELALLLLVPVVILIVAALAANRLQHSSVFSFEPIMPKLSAIDPLKGLKDMFSTNALVDLTKSLLKLGIVGGAGVLVLWPERHRLDAAAAMEPIDIAVLSKGLIIKLMITVLVVLAVIATLDYGWAWWRHHKNLRMSKQELKDEHKDSEGDPKIKAKIRQIRLERAQKRMMAEVPTASVVVTNPTHYAVALKYDGTSMSAPRLVAKGVDSMAKKIREVAEQHGVPIVENPPIARAIHANVELDQEIPPAMYKAVAEIIGYVMKLKRNRPWEARAGS